MKILNILGLIALSPLFANAATSTQLQQVETMLKGKLPGGCVVKQLDYSPKNGSSPETLVAGIQSSDGKIVQLNLVNAPATFFAFTIKTGTDNKGPWTSPDFSRLNIMGTTGNDDELNFVFRDQTGIEYLHAKTGRTDSQNPDGTEVTITCSAI